jgi:hypothetical protein
MQVQLVTELTGDFIRVHEEPLGGGIHIVPLNLLESVNRLRLKLGSYASFSVK